MKRIAHRVAQDAEDAENAQVAEKCQVSLESGMVTAVASRERYSRAYCLPHALALTYPLHLLISHYNCTAVVYFKAVRVVIRLSDRNAITKLLVAHQRVFACAKLTISCLYLRIDRQT